MALKSGIMEDVSIEGLKHGRAPVTFVFCAPVVSSGVEELVRPRLGTA